jgi:hypothetical protein
MVQFIYLVNGKVWDTLATIAHQDKGIQFTEDNATYWIPYTAILYIQTGIKHAGH